MNSKWKKIASVMVVMNEHAALVAVAEAAKGCEELTRMRQTRAEPAKDLLANVGLNLRAALANLAAIRNQ
jgi:hypothetical protein